MPMGMPVAIRSTSRTPSGSIPARTQVLGLSAWPKEYLAEHGDPFMRKLMNAPFDDEPVTEEEEAGVREAWADYRAGRVQTLDEVEKELGL